jgi:hypothetical protein
VSVATAEVLLFRVREMKAVKLLLLSLLLLLLVSPGPASAAAGSGSWDRFAAEGPFSADAEAVGALFVLVLASAYTSASAAAAGVIAAGLVGARPLVVTVVTWSSTSLTFRSRSWSR